MKAGQSLPSAALVPNIQLAEPGEGGLDLGQVFATLRRKALLIAGVTIAVAAAAGAAALVEAPKYATGFEILIAPTNAETEVISSIPEALTGKTEQPKAVTEDLIKILTSPRLLLPVVKQLEAQNPGACSKLISGAAGRRVEIKTFDASAANGCYSVVVSNLAITKGGRNVKILAGSDSNILGVSFQSEDAKVAEAFAKLLAQAYLDYSLESRQADVRRGIQFVEKKLPDLQQRVEVLQGQLQQLRQDYNLIDPESRGSQLSSQVSSFSQEQRDNRIQLEQLQTIYNDLESQLAQISPETAASSALSQNPRFQTLMNQILELNSKIAAASTLYRPDSPDMQVLLEERQNLLLLLADEGDQARRELLGQIRELETRDQALQDTLNALGSGVNELSGISRAYADIQRELDISTQNLNQFLAKREALQIDAAQQEVPWEVLSPPTKPQPSATTVMRNLILGAALGLLLGTGAALVVDRLTDVIHSPDELKRLTRLPLLGAIPLNRNIDDYLAQRTVSPQQVAALAAESPSARDGYQTDPFFESFRSLYANIRLLNSDDPIRSLVVSSTTPQEGKSITAAYLAQAAAAMGRRVLLIDTDLRRPQVHRYIGIDNSRGLTNLIADAQELSRVVQRSPQEPNLWVIPAGTIPPDPTRFLSSQKMQNLMEQVRNQFDLVIYDTPPLLGFADAFLMAAQTNGLILVTELGKIKRSLLEQSIEQLRVSNTPVLGVVVQKTTASHKI